MTQSQLKQSLEALAKLGDPALVARVGPLAELLGTITTAALDSLRSEVAALEVLRRTDPKTAAADMVAAHNGLAAALASDRSFGRLEQVEAVVRTVGLSSIMQRPCARPLHRAQVHERINMLDAGAPWLPPAGAAFRKIHPAREH